VVNVEEVQMPGATKRFCKAWWPIYEPDPHWVPPLIFERKQFFDPKKNPFFAHARTKYFIATRDGRDVGTIAVTVDDKLLEHEPGVGMFGFFEFVNDPAVAKALLEAGSAWLRGEGMTKVRGPFNLSPNHEFGLLVDGFDTDPCVANPHNSAYYPGIYESIGLVSVKDWYAYWMDNGEVPPTIERIAKRFMKRNPELRIREVDLSRWDEEIELVYDIYMDAWEHNWGHVGLTREEFLFSAAGMKQIIDPKLCYFAYMGDELAGMSVTLPDYNQVAKKMNGSIFPFGWWHFLTGAKKIDALRIFILGIKQKFQRLPLGAPLYLKTWETGSKMSIRGAEASLILEDNHRMRGALEKLGGRVYKTYRSYEFPLADGVEIQSNKNPSDDQA